MKRVSHCGQVDPETQWQRGTGGYKKPAQLPETMMTSWIRLVLKVMFGSMTLLQLGSVSYRWPKVPPKAMPMSLVWVAT